MIIGKLLEEMMGRQTECEHMTVLLPLPIAVEVRDLAAQLGVPCSRLMTELVAAGISEAQYEWRRISIERPEVPQFSLKVDMEG